MATTTATIELTAIEKDNLCGGHWEDRFPIPDESQFDAVGLGRLAAPELAAIARRLIARDDLGIGHLSRFRLMFLWAKAGGTSGGKPRWGSVALATPDLKHVTEQWEGQPADAVVRLAADNLRAAQATRWQVANELCFCLSRIGLYTTQEGGDERLTLVSPDAAFFTPQMRLFGPQTPELKRTILDIRQARFEWAATLANDIARADAAAEFDPSPPQASGVEEEIGPTPDGAPAADWADGYRPDLDPPLTDDEVVAVDAARERVAERLALIRANFPTEIRDGGEFCTACGVDVFDHDPEVCAGGTPQTRAKRKRRAPSADLSGELATAAATVETNGAHDPAVGEVLRNGADDFAQPNIDVDRVLATLSQAGTVIGWDEIGGGYLNPVSGERYSLSWVEGEYRSAISGR
jgi:hypothetical protein